MNQLAAAKATENAAEALEKLPKAIETMTKGMGAEAGKAFKNSYAASEGKAMTKGDVKALEGLVHNGMELNRLWSSLSEEEKEAFGNVKGLKDHLTESITLANNAFETATATLVEMNGEVELNEKLTSESAQGYADQLENIMSAVGQEGVDAVDGALDAIAESMSEEDFNKFVGQINAINWKNLDDWEKLPETLQNIGINVPNAALEDFITNAQTAAGAIR
jgi:uncharacterized protein (UPF0210 family)